MPFVYVQGKEANKNIVFPLLHYHFYYSYELDIHVRNNNYATKLVFCDKIDNEVQVHHFS